MCVARDPPRRDSRRALRRAARRGRSACARVCPDSCRVHCVAVRRAGPRSCISFACKYNIQKRLSLPHIPLLIQFSSRPPSSIRPPHPDPLPPSPLLLILSHRLNKKLTTSPHLESNPHLGIKPPALSLHPPAPSSSSSPLSPFSPHRNNSHLSRTSSRTAPLYEAGVEQTGRCSGQCSAWQ